MQTAQALNDLLKNPAIWRIGQIPPSVRAAIKTGHTALDHALPAHGWECGALTEILSDEQGIGELSLLIPALRQTTQKGQGVVLVAPPYIPFPHALESAGIALKHVVIVRADGQNMLYALEKAARSGSCGMVIGWHSSKLSYHALRRLQSAAEKGNTVLMLFRQANSAQEASAAPTRITVNAQEGKLQLHVIKRRGALMASPISLHCFPMHWARRRTGFTPAPRSVPTVGAISLTVGV